LSAVVVGNNFIFYFLFFLKKKKKRKKRKRKGAKANCNLLSPSSNVSRDYDEYRTLATEIIYN
jgi:hypothetical protein